MDIDERYLRLMSESEWINVLDKYKEEDLFEKENKLIKRFYIPPEISISDYITSRTKIYKDVGGWTTAKFINKKILGVTNGILTGKDYIDIFMYRILDGIGPRCPRCNKPLSINHGLSNPYYTYCSISCFTSDMNYRLWSDENSPFRTEEYKSLKKRLASEMANEGRIGLSNKYCSLGNSLSIYSKYETMYFYLVYDEYKFKIGISHTFNAKDRLYRLNLNSEVYFNIDECEVLLYKGDYKSVVTLENEIKFSEEFINNRFMDIKYEGWTEIFDIKLLNKAIDLINSYNLDKILFDQ